MNCPELEKVLSSIQVNIGPTGLENTSLVAIWFQVWSESVKVVLRVKVAFLPFIVCEIVRKDLIKYVELYVKIK